MKKAVKYNLLCSCLSLASLIAFVVPLNAIAAPSQGLASALSKSKLSKPAEDEKQAKGKLGKSLRLEGALDLGKSKRDKELEPYYWNLNIALMRQARGNENFSEVITAYTQLVEQACMGNLESTLKYSGENKSNDCLKAIQDFSKIAPMAPSLVCARDGIDANTCIEAHRGMEIAPQQLNVNATSEADKIFGETRYDILERVREKSKKLFNFGTAEKFNALPEKERKEKLPKVHRILQDVLEIACKDVTYGVEKKKSAPKKQEKFSFLRSENIKKKVATGSTSNLPKRGTRPAPPSLKKSAKAGLPDMRIKKSSEEGGFFDEAETLTAKKEIRKVQEDERIVRYITQNCQTQIDTSFRWDATFYAAVCAQYGEYSPNCVELKRQYREKLSKERSTVKRKRPVRSGKVEKGRPDNLFKTF